uniref:Uncharacterized protein n=1 Tax=Dunaliella tertiolecta TaxID=3047 RepID=A0A7S3VRH7_DUNTE
MPAEEQHTDSGPSLCAICGDEVDEAVDYTTALTCSFWGCGRHNVKGLYHTECVGDYQRQNSITKGANTGYLCPRGNSRAEIDKDNPCRGKIQATHHRLPNKKKKQPPQPLPAAMFPSRQLQAPKPKAPKPHTPGPPPKAPKPVSKEAIQRQVLACRQATQATQGDSVLERLRGGPQPQQPSVIPGMEFEVKKKKPAKKKSKASKQHQSEAPQEGAAADGKPAPKSVSLTQLPNIMPKMDGENYITDLNRYNLLVGGQYSSEDETDDEVSDAEGSGSEVMQ